MTAPPPSPGHPYSAQGYGIQAYGTQPYAGQDYHGSWSTPPPPPAYGPPGPYGYGYPPAQTCTNGLAIASMVLGIVWIYWIGSILAIVFGHVSLHQMKRKPYQTGRGMAIAGLVLGYLGLATLTVTLVALVLVAGSAPAEVGGVDQFGEVRSSSG